MSLHFRIQKNSIQNFRITNCDIVSHIQIYDYDIVKTLFMNLIYY
jgi:hypothetical protein